MFDNRETEDVSFSALVERVIQQLVRAKSRCPESSFSWQLFCGCCRGGTKEGGLQTVLRKSKGSSQPFEANWAMVQCEGLRWSEELGEFDACNSGALTCVFWRGPILFWGKGKTTPGSAQSIFLAFCPGAPPGGVLGGNS